MQTSGYNIFYPTPSDQALAQTQMAMMATSIDGAMRNESDARIAQTDAVEARTTTLESGLARETTIRGDADKALASAINARITKDTGWRAVPFDDPSVVSDGEGAKRSAFLQIRRVGNTVYLRGYARLAAPESGSGVLLYAVPEGFRDVNASGESGESSYWSWRGDCTGYGFASVEDSKGSVQYTTYTNKVYATGVTVNGSAWLDGTGFVNSWPATDPWPKELPGTEVTKPTEDDTSGYPYTIETIKVMLDKEIEDRKVADTALEGKIEQAGVATDNKLSSLKSELKSEVKTVQDAVDKINEERLFDLKAYMADLVQQQLQPGRGFNLLFSGSSTAEGYGSAGMNNNNYNGRSWVERVVAAMTPNGMKWNIDGLGAVFGPPSTGIFGYQFSKGGTTSNDYMPQGKIDQAGIVKPAVMFHAVGSNNYGNQWGLDDFESQVRDVIDKVNAKSPNTRHVLVNYQTLNGLFENNPPLKWWQYNDRMKKIAATRKDTYFIDLTPDTWTMGMPGANHWWYYQTDQNHVTQNTHKYYAEKILMALGLAVPPSHTEVFEWPVIGGGDKGVGNNFANRSVGKRAWPRMITTQGVIFGRAASSGAYFNIKTNGNDNANPSLTTNTSSNPMGMSISHSFYLPSNVEGFVSLTVDNSPGYISGSFDYQSVVSYGCPA